MHTKAFALGCLVSLGACSTPEASPHDPLWQEVAARNRAMEERFRAGDMGGVAAFYTDDAMLISGSGRRTVGRAAIDAYWAGIRAPRDWQLEVFDVRGNGRVVHQRGRSTLITERDGAEHRSIVDFALVWTRGEDGELRIAVDAYW